MIQIQVIKLSKPVIYLTYPQGACLFNVPEGFQRYSADYALTLKQGLKIFLTQSTPQHGNGLIGLLLTLNFEKIIDDTILFGPKGLCDLVECARNNEIGGLNLYKMRVFEFGGRQLNIWHENENEAIRKQVQMDFDHYQDQTVNIQQIVYQQKIISYLIRIVKQKGKIHKELLKQLKLSNIEQAILFQKGELKKDERLIHAHELREPEVPEQLILILDIVDDTQLELFDVNLNYLSVYHINSPKTQKYHEFIDQLKCDHVFCNSEQENQYSHLIPKSKYICNILHTQYPHNFPSIVQHFQEQQQQQQQQQQQHLYIQTFHTYIIHPVHKRGYQILPQIPQQSEVRKYDFPYNRKQHTSKVRITFLGTASMKPNKYRNVSSILIDNDGQPILLDCGEGTLRQLQDQSFKNENPILIYISHIHSDHNLGLGCLMAEYNNLCLLLPSSMIPWVIILRRVYGITNPYTIIPIDPSLVEEDFMKQKLQYPKDLPIISLKEIQFKCKITIVPVVHCPQAYGIRFDFDEGTSLTYSGDTRPCQSFMELSLNADIMIHEATFTDDLTDKAKKTNHSTAREAVLLGMEANCKCVILTHFSQRFTKCSSVPNMEEDYLKTRTAMAIDHLSGQLDEFIELVPLSQELQNE